MLWPSLLLVVVHLASAAPPTPEEFGFRHVRLEARELAGNVDVYVADGGRAADSTGPKPLVVFLQGSGYAPILFGDRERPGSTLLFRPDQFPGWHYAVIGKPAAPFWMERLPNRDEVPAAYHNRLSLPWRVEATRVAVEHLAAQPWVDPSRIVLVGHSEGAQVVAPAALATPAVTHVVALGASGLTQAHDWITEVRVRVAEGHMSFEEGEAEIARRLDVIRAISRDPDATDRFYRGHSHRRWSTFFRPPLDAFTRLDVPIFVGVAAGDRASPIGSADAIAVEFAKLGKQNLTYRAWPTDHGFREPTQAGVLDRRPDVLAAVLAWVNDTAKQ